MDLAAYIEEAKKRLRVNGGRVTESRIQTLQLIYTAKKPVGALEIEKRLNKKLAKAVDRATVFRMLNAFTDLGLIHRVEDASAYIPCKHFDCSHGYHVVLSCERCGACEEVELPERMFEDTRQYCTEHFSFAISDRHAQLEGVCNKCQ